MLNFANCDPAVLDMTSVVISDLVDRAQIDPDTVLLVGAGCRDAIHSALGHTFSLRGTTDTDIGLALTDWEMFNRIDSIYSRSGDTGIRYLIAGMIVDVMPFGGVENPVGVVTPESRRADISVFGFDDVYQKAGRISLPSGHVIRIPYPAGYAALKMRAWIDRSAYGEYKDGGDLSVIRYWYRESKEVLDALWLDEPESGLLGKWDYDEAVASMEILGRDVEGQLSEENWNDLRRRWGEIDRELLAERFRTSTAGPPDIKACRRLVDVLILDQK